MTPVANFLVSPNLLTVQFTDISTGTPTQWLWDFGDNTAAAITQNPSHTYSTAGTYTVQLTATNADGVSTIQRIIIVASVPVLPVTVLTLVNIKLQGNTATEEAKQAYISQWQLYIQPLVDPEVPFSSVFDETLYPPLANVLVAYLAAYSILSDIAAAGGVAAGGGGTNGNTAVVKKIVTGPSEVEFQDNSSSQRTLYGDKGLLAELRKEICTLAHRLLIKLPMCPPLPDVKLIDLKAGRPNELTSQVPSNLWTIWPSNYNLAI